MEKVRVLLLLERDAREGSGMKDGSAVLGETDNQRQRLEVRQVLRAEHSALLEVIRQEACVLRPKPITDSGASRSPVPAQADHPFRAKPITDSGVIDRPGAVTG